MSKPKIEFLDTNVHAHDPDSMFAFDDNIVVVSDGVMKELDKLKKFEDITGKYAREVLAKLRSLQEERKLGAITGGKIPSDDSRRIWVMPPLKNQKNLEGDDLLFAEIEYLKSKNKEREVIAVSKDSGFAIRAFARGITVEPYKHDRIENIYAGVSEIEVATLPEFGDNNVAELPPEFFDGSTHYPNECIIFREKDDPSREVRAFYRSWGERRVLQKLYDDFRNVSWAEPRNPEQKFELALAANPSIDFLMIKGPAGAGKDYIPLAVALQGLESGDYKRIVLATAEVGVRDQKLAFLPGDLDEKQRPWVQPFLDNIDEIYAERQRKQNKGGKKSNTGTSYAEQLLKRGKQSGTGLVIASLNHILGSTFRDSFFIISDVQNLRPRETKNVGTRIGKRSKMIFTGDIDPSQITAPYLDPHSCGLAHLIERFKVSPIAGTVTLIKSERSFAAEEAARLL